MKRLIAIAAVTAASLAVGGTAFAGEVTGNGKPTPVSEYRAGSICSFSGLNDVPDGSDSPGDPFAPGKVQNFGDGVNEVVRTFPGNPSDYVDLLQANKPGIFCKGYASGG